ncbi:hypothetical protein BKH42_08510 [Helicobacter sp. 13S00482-2]|nr:hypothetical protein BKH42_08510 [Helicobacter sp. 13S00482-2]
MRKTTRNKQIHEYATQKFKSQKTDHKKHPLNIKYINLKRGNKSISNTILILENSKACFEYAHKNKKSYSHYVEVIFAGFHQPSKDIDSLSLKILKAFLKRFKVYSIDLAGDFNWNHSVNNANKALLAKAVEKYIQGDGNIRNEGSSLYVNATKTNHHLCKILLYDKYKKQTEYHKENIHPHLREWKRLEITLGIKKRFFKWIEDDEVNDGISLLNDITLKLGGRGIIGLSVEVLSKQIQKLKDLRRGIYFPAWAKIPKKEKNKPKTRKEYQF